VEGRQSEWSISYRPSRTCGQCGIGAASSKASTFRSVLHEPDHVIDVRKPTGEVGLSEASTSDGQSSSAPASLVDVAPNKRSTAAIVPQPRRGADAQHLPQRPDAEGQEFLYDRCPNACWAIGARRRRRQVVHRYQPRGAPFSYARQTRPPGCKQGDGGGCLHLRHRPNPITKAKWWREPHRARAISMPAPSQLQSNETLPRADALP
jgi:hypothetical protein